MQVKSWITEDYHHRSVRFLWSRSEITVSEKNPTLIFFFFFFFFSSSDGSNDLPLSLKKKKKKSAKDLYSASATDNEHDTPRSELESVFTS